MIRKKTTDTSTQARATAAASSNSSQSSSSSARAAAFDQYSGYAEGVSGNSRSSVVDTTTLNAVNTAISTSGMSSVSLSNLKPSLAKESVKINQSLAEAQNNYNILQSQKTTAEENVTKLQGQVDGAETEARNTKTTLDTNKSSLNSSIEARDNMDEQLSSVNEEYKETCANVKTQEKNKSSAQSEVSSAKTSVSKAESTLSSATQSLEAAKTNLASVHEKLEDGTPNPQYKLAKEAVKQAEVEKQNAEKSLEDAKTNLSSAEEKLNSAEADLAEAQQKKDSVLQNLQKTENQYKSLAANCEKMQDQVENNQKQYDLSLEKYDNTNATYERLNTELESQQGILTQYEATENQIASLKEAATSVNDLNKKLDDKITQVKQQEAKSGTMSAEQKAQVENDVLAHSSSSEGCSASKTPLENMIASKDYDLSKCTGEVWSQNLNNVYGTAAEFENQGYIKNSDGSFTDPRTGITMVNVKGDDYEWLPAGSTFSPESGDYVYGNLVGRDWPGAADAAERSKLQQNITLNGFDENGKPKFKWK